MGIFHYLIEYEKRRSSKRELRQRSKYELRKRRDLARNIVNGRCNGCHKKIEFTLLQRAIPKNIENGSFFCENCRGEKPLLFIDSYDFLENLENENSFYGKGINRLGKRLNKLIQKYNTLAKENDFKPEEHFMASANLKYYSLRGYSEYEYEPRLHEDKYTDTYVDLFDADETYSMDDEKELIMIGKTLWNHYHLKKVFDALLIAYNDLVEKYNNVSKDIKRESLEAIDLE